MTKFGRTSSLKSGKIVIVTRKKLSYTPFYLISYTESLDTAVPKSLNLHLSPTHSNHLQQDSSNGLAGFHKSQSNDTQTESSTNIYHRVTSRSQIQYRRQISELGDIRSDQLALSDIRQSQGLPSFNLLDIDPLLGFHMLQENLTQWEPHFLTTPFLKCGRSMNDEYKVALQAVQISCTDLARSNPHSPSSLCYKRVIQSKKILLEIFRHFLSCASGPTTALKQH